MATKITIVLITFLLLGSVSASDLQTIRDRSYEQINISTTGAAQIDTATLNTIIQRGVVQVCEDFPAYVQAATIDLTRKTMSYSMPDDFLEVGWDTLMWCVYFSNNDDTTTYPLPNVPPGVIYAKIIGMDQTNENNRQTSHVWAFGGKLYVWPSPMVDDDSVLLGYRAVDTALTASGAGSSLDIGSAYWEDLVNWVCYKALERVGRYPEAAIFGAEYEKARVTQ